jgi:hypothetical protein
MWWNIVKHIKRKWKTTVGRPWRRIYKTLLCFHPGPWKQKTIATAPPKRWKKTKNLNMNPSSEPPWCSKGPHASWAGLSSKRSLPIRRITSDHTKGYRAKHSAAIRNQLQPSVVYKWGGCICTLDRFCERSPLLPSFQDRWSELMFRLCPPSNDDLLQLVCVWFTIGPLHKRWPTTSLAHTVLIWGTCET